MTERLVGENGLDIRLPVKVGSAAPDEVFYVLVGNPRAFDDWTRLPGIYFPMSTVGKSENFYDYPQ